MRIAKVTGGYPPAFSHGGTATAAHGLCKALRAQGHSVFVLSTDLDGSRRLDTRDTWTNYEGIPVYYAPASRRPMPYRCPALVQELERMLPDIDVVLLDSAFTWYGPMVARACRKRGVPYVLYPHGSLQDELRTHPFFRKKLWWELFDRRMVEAASAVVAVTEREAEHLRRLGVTPPVVLIPNGVEQIQEVPDGRAFLERRFGIPKDQKLIVFLGRLVPKKGVDILVMAFASVSRRFEDVLLVIAGPDEGGELRRTETLVTRLGLGERTVFTGAVYGEDKWVLLQSASAFVLPSRGEGLAVAVLEALECRVPVVITHECGFPEVATHRAGFVIPRDVEEVAESLVRLLRDPELSAAMGANGLALVRERYRWDAIAAQTINLCSNVKDWSDVLLTREGAQPH